MLVYEDNGDVLPIGVVFEGILYLSHRRSCTKPHLAAVLGNKHASAAALSSLSVTTRKFLFFLISMLPTPANKNPVTVSCRRQARSACHQNYQAATACSSTK